MIIDRIEKTKPKNTKLRKPTRRILLLMPSRDKKGPALETTNLGEERGSL